MGAWRRRHVLADNPEWVCRFILFYIECYRFTIITSTMILNKGNIGREVEVGAVFGAETLGGVTFWTMDQLTPVTGFSLAEMRLSANS